MKTALVWLCKTPRGWRRFPVLTETDSKTKYERARIGWVNDGGVETYYPEGKFQIRSFRDGKQHFETTKNQDHAGYVIREWKEETKKREPAKGIPSTHGLLKNAANAYVKALDDQGKHTAATHARLVLDEFMTVCKTAYVRSVTEKCVTDYQNLLRKSGLTKADIKGNKVVANGARTVANKTARLKAFFKHNKLKVDWMPKAPKHVEKKVDVYSQEQLGAIRKAANPYMRVVIDMAVMLGLREQELAFATWDSVNWEQSTFKVKEEQSEDYKPANKEKGIKGQGWKFTPKDKEEREMGIPAVLLARLKAHREAQAPSMLLILPTGKGKPNAHMLKALKNLARAAGLNCGKCQGCKARTEHYGEYKIEVNVGEECYEWTLHKFRRTALTTMLRNGIDAKTVQEFAGHSSLDTTLRYLAPAESKDTQTKLNTMWTD
jgi:integrase